LLRDIAAGRRHILNVIDLKPSPSHQDLDVPGIVTDSA
jgi:hypothetical protein